MALIRWSGARWVYRMVMVREAWPRKFLHSHDIHASHDQVGGKGVSEVMEADIFNLSLFHSTTELPQYAKAGFSVFYG